VSCSLPDDCLTLRIGDLDWDIRYALDHRMRTSGVLRVDDASVAYVVDSRHEPIVTFSYAGTDTTVPVVTVPHPGCFGGRCFAFLSRDGERRVRVLYFIEEGFCTEYEVGLNWRSRRELVRARAVKELLDLEAHSRVLLRHRSLTSKVDRLRNA
jgi:hypothetical protein